MDWTPPQKPKRRSYEYAVSPFDDRYEFASVFTVDAPYWLAQEAAEDYFNEHDGWECSWPLVFEVFSDDVSLGSWSVDMESVPQFTAIRLEGK